MPVDRPRARLLMAIRKEQSGKRQEIPPAPVRAVKDDPIPAQRAGGNIGDVGIDEAQFAQRTPGARDNGIARFGVLHTDGGGKNPRLCDKGKPASR